MSQSEVILFMLAFYVGLPLLVHFIDSCLARGRTPGQQAVDRIVRERIERDRAAGLPQTVFPVDWSKP